MTTLRLRVLAAAVVATTATISFTSIYELAVYAGLGWLAVLFPVCLDAVAAIGLELWVRKAPAWRPAAVLAMTAVGLSLAANIGHWIIAGSTVAAVLGAVPPVMLAAVLLVLHRNARPESAGEAAAPSDVPAVSPALEVPPVPAPLPPGPAAVEQGGGTPRVDDGPVPVPPPSAEETTAELEPVPAPAGTGDDQHRRQVPAGTPATVTPIAGRNRHPAPAGGIDRARRAFRRHRQAGTDTDLTGTAFATELGVSPGMGRRYLRKCRDEADELQEATS